MSLAEGFHICRECGEMFTGKHGSLYCSGRCKSRQWRRARKERESVPPTDTVTLFVRAPDCEWDADRVLVTRIKITPRDVELVEGLPVPEWPEDLGEGQVVRLDGTTVVVVDQPTGQRWVIRRAACGETCCCAVQGWPVGYDGPISPADPYAALSMLATSVREFRRLSKLEAG